MKIEAVSALKIRGPSEMMLNPLTDALEISSSVNPPSGPTKNNEWVGKN